MRIFVTGASGWIGSAVVPELIGAGHSVLGLARSDASAQAVATMGAEVLRGDLTDTRVLSAGARDSDGVIHLAFVVPSVSEAATRADAAAIEAFVAGLAGSGKPMLISGATLVTPGRPATERDEIIAAQHLGAQGGDCLGGVVRAGEPEDLVAGPDELGDDGRADPAGRAGDEDAHGRSPC